MIGLKDKTAREVDDAVALIMALKHPDKVQLVGISEELVIDALK